MKKLTIENAIQLAVQKLQPLADKASATTDAEYLLTSLLNKNFTWLKTWPDYQLDEEQQSQFISMLERRHDGEPIAYITGERGFWSLTLNTNPSTLIPRPETELLVESALEFLQGYQKADILDLGTGTGAIALAIATERKGDTLLASDFNPAAVELAKINATRNQIENVKFIQSDWFKTLSADQGNQRQLFDLIVSNPPYIAEGDPHLKTGDLVFEPDSALIAKDQGFADIRLIITQAREFLMPDGCVMLEHGFDQAEEVREILVNSGYSSVTTIRDLNGIERVTSGIFKRQDNK